MQTSSHKLTKKQQQQLTDQFITLLSDLRQPNECKTFFESFLTTTEQQVFTKRLGIVWMLHQRKSYDEIKQALHVSSATISSVVNQMKKTGLKLTVDKLRINHWAESWTKKILGLFSH